MEWLVHRQARADAHAVAPNCGAVRIFDSSKRCATLTSACRQRPEHNSMSTDHLAMAPLAAHAQRHLLFTGHQLELVSLCASGLLSLSSSLLSFSMIRQCWIYGSHSRTNLCVLAFLQWKSCCLVLPMRPETFKLLGMPKLQVSRCAPWCGLAVSQLYEVWHSILCPHHTFVRTVECTSSCCCESYTSAPRNRIPGTCHSNGALPLGPHPKFKLPPQRGACFDANLGPAMLPRCFWDPTNESQ